MKRYKTFYDVICKNNPYHDELGRFTNKPGSTGIKIPEIRDEYVRLVFKENNQKAAEKLKEKVTGIYRNLFNQLDDGEIDGFYYETQKNNDNGQYLTYLYTNSTKDDGIQCSCFLNRDDELIPLSHQTFKDWKACEKKNGYKEGVEINVIRNTDTIKKAFDEALLKYNPYHDEQGRFASSDSGKKVVAVFDFHFNMEDKECEKLTKKARTERFKYFQVTGLHSNGRKFMLDDGTERAFSPKTLAKIIKSDKMYDGRDVKIYACSAGRGNAAQVLANELGVKVKAPIDKLMLLGRGEFVVCEGKDENDFPINPYKDEDGWKVFEPR